MDGKVLDDLRNYRVRALSVFHRSREGLQGMLLSADEKTSVTEVANASRPYIITAWDHIG